MLQQEIVVEIHSAENKNTSNRAFGIGLNLKISIFADK